MLDHAEQLDTWFQGDGEALQGGHESKNDKEARPPNQSGTRDLSVLVQTPVGNLLLIREQDRKQDTRRDAKV